MESADVHPRLHRLPSHHNSCDLYVSCPWSVPRLLDTVHHGYKAVVRRIYMSKPFQPFPLWILASDSQLLKLNIMLCYITSGLLFPDTETKTTPEFNVVQM